MEFLTNNLQTIITIAVALFVLCLLLMAWRACSPRVAGGRRGQRLAISEYYEVDKLRRLVLVKRDGVEHLILIGGPQDIVIEQNIGAAPAPQAQPLPRAMASADYAPTPPAGTAKLAPRASVYVDRPAGAAAPPGTRQEPEL